MKKKLLPTSTLLLGVLIGVIAGLFLSPEKRATLSRRLTVPLKRMMEQMPDG